MQAVADAIGVLIEVISDRRTGPWRGKGTFVKSFQIDNEKTDIENSMLSKADACKPLIRIET